MLKNRSLKEPMLVAGLILLVVVIGLALIGPSIGNIFNNNVSSLSDGVGASVGYAPSEPMMESDVADGDTTVARSADDQPLGVNQEQQQPGTDRIILRNATLVITANDPASTISEIMTMAESMGGWVVSSSTSQFTNVAGEPDTRGYITIRVPAAQLDTAMMQIQAGAIEVTSESVTGQDVTTEYVDLTSRQRNLEIAESQLQEIMGRAADTADVIAVHNELTRIRGEIESIRGRIQYFDEAAAFASIQITVNPVPVGPVEAQSAGWNPLNAVENALGVLVGLIQGLIDTGITLAIIGLPILIVIGIPAWWIWRRRQPRALPESA